MTDRVARRSDRDDARRSSAPTESRAQSREHDTDTRWLVPPDPHQPLRARWDPTGVESSGTRQARPDRKRQSKVGRFVSTYGWRAYALPVLTAVTVLVMVDAVRGGLHHPLLPATTGGEGPSLGVLSHPSAGVIGAPPRGDGHFASDIPTGALPPGGSIAADAKGSWHVVAGSTPQVGKGDQQVFTYSVEVEDGIDVTGFGGDVAVAAMVDQTLANPKSWTKDPRFAFRRIDAGDPTFRISLSSQGTTRRSCGFDIPIDSSCYNADIGRVVLDEARWVRGALSFQGDMGSYRQYMINHEVGHAIGYAQHQPCQENGGLAPVMMQQTFGTSDNDIAKLDPEGVVPKDGKTCHYNPWPYPRG